MDVRSLRRAVVRRLAALRAWVAWSPRRAGTVVGVCLTVLLVSPVAAGITRNVTAQPASTDAGTPVATPSPTSSSGPGDAVQPGGGAPVVTATPSGPDDSDTEASAADQSAASAAAARFASLWLAGAFIEDRKRWTDTLSPLVDPSLRPFLLATPASAIPRTSLATSVPQLVAPTFGAVRVTFADGTGMDLQMSQSGSRWRVVQYLPTATP